MIPQRFAANVAWLFTEHDWLDRFAAARDAGFSRVEFPWPDDPAATAAAVADANLRVALINAPAGDLAAGERGWPNDPTRIGEWRDGFRTALALAVDVGCPTLNVLAGNRIESVSGPDQLDCLERNLGWALSEASTRGVAVVTELLNRHENPDYLLATIDDARPFLDSLAGDGWKLQLDTWHLGLTHPDIAAQVRSAAPHIGHVQVADVPGRNEPGTGSLNWEAIASALRDAGYEGPIGLEYRPTTGFAWSGEISLVA